MTESRLHKSIEQYREIFAHARQLDALLSRGESELLVNYTKRLNELQQEAALNDQPMLEEIARDSTFWQTSPLLLERTQLLKQIVEMNDLLLPRVRGMMAVAAAEMAQLKDGRVAISGYQQRPTHNRNSARGVG
ncbi:MAG TPA: hypothetical protein VIR78_10275 [Malonomonas sp.]